MTILLVENCKDMTAGKGPFVHFDSARGRGLCSSIEPLASALYNMFHRWFCCVYKQMLCLDEDGFSRKREQSTVTCMTMDCSSEEMLEVCQEEPKEEPVYDIVLPNSTSYAHSIASGGGVVIRHL